MLPSDDLSTLLANWDLDPIVSIEVFDTANYRFSYGKVVFINTRTEKYVLKRMAVQPARETNYSLLAALHAQGVPVAVPKLTREGAHLVQQGEENYCLSPYLAGAVISDHYGTGAEERARRVGIALAQLHNGLKHCEHLEMRSEMDLLREVEAGRHVLHVQAEEHAAEWMERVLSELISGLAQVYPELPIQLIHRDAHAANLLFLDEQVSGWLDFELIVRGPRIFDPCYAATSILMDAIDNPSKQLRWLALLVELVKGYSSVNPLTIVERSALWYILLSIEVIFAAYFTQSKDEKGITQNLEALLWIYEHRHQIQECLQREPADR